MPEAKIIDGIGESVRILRSRLGISQEELAERSGLHRTFIARVEGGSRNVTLKSVVKLAEALRVSVSKLLSTSEDGLNAKEIAREELVDILLVEDDPDDVRLTLNAFQEARIGNSVWVARDGAEALKYLWCEGAFSNRTGQKQPRVILLDLGLPDMSGLEVLRRLKRDNRTHKIPVVILTASKKGRDVTACLELGAVNYIVKPVCFRNFSEITPDLKLDWVLLDRNRQ